MTDPKTRRPEFWRTFAWVMACGAAVMLAGGVLVVVTGGRAGWLDIGLAAIFTTQSVLYFRQYRRAKTRTGIRTPDMNQTRVFAGGAFVLLHTTRPASPSRSPSSSPQRSARREHGRPG